MANFDQWHSGRKVKHFRKRVRKGIPDCVRGKVWQMMSGSLVSGGKFIEVMRWSGFFPFLRGYARSYSILYEYKILWCDLIQLLKTCPLSRDGCGSLVKI